MSYHQITKSFLDYADDIEAVNIHYAVTPIDGAPDWNRQRSTRYMPLVDGRTRLKTLKLPTSIEGSTHQTFGRYVLHYYFEIFQGGDRHYSPLYSEEVVTTQPSADNMSPIGASSSAHNDADRRERLKDVVDR